MLLLGLDTSCDDTSAALVEAGFRVLSSVVSSRVELHRDFGGIVPEIACRSHIRDLVPVIETALKEAGRTLGEVQAVAVTNRPGLIGALLIGLTAAKTLAYSLRLPLVALDHVSSHIYSVHMEHPDLGFPYVSLVVSGGHTHLYYCTGHFDHRMIGKTLDDAAGEAFDKVAAILRLGYPGGRHIETAASGAPIPIRASTRQAQPARTGTGRPRLVGVHFKRPFLGKDSLDFSFSGIKTAVLYHVRGQDAGRRKRKARSGKERPPMGSTQEIAAEFQQAVVEVLVGKLLAAADKMDVRTVTLCGGVAANGHLREALAHACDKAGLSYAFPSKKLCTDNAAMVAGLGWHYATAGRYSPLGIDALATSW